LKPDLHPKYRPVVYQDTSSDFAFLTRSTIETDETIEWEDGKTYPLAKLEISSASHPFYTGKQILVDSGGRVERFRRRYAKVGVDTERKAEGRGRHRQVANLSRPPGASVGGQAVMEGVMMRAPTQWAVACRRPDGSIITQRNELPNLSGKSRWRKVPFVRGVLVLIESLSLGFKALSWSAVQSGAEEEDELTKGQVFWTMALAIVVALALFILLPAFAANYLKTFLGDSSIGFVIVDGILRIALIVLYIWAISRSKEIARVFQYHGAEHKTIHAYENGDPLAVEAIQAYSPRHPRCGTSFILIVAMVAFVVFLALAPLPFVWQVLARIVLIPLIAGLSYEVLKAGRNHSNWMSWANQPGIWLQRITTKEPSDDMVEVAVASLLAALSEEEAAAVAERGPIVAGALAAEREIPGDG
jgi:ribosomal protein L31